jgi:E3 ubiquitin-protein ligase SIAH1
MYRPSKNDTKALTPKVLLAALECPVCLDYSFGLKIYNCGNGHSVCENCHPHLSECPTCKGPPTVVRNYGLESIAENVVVECPFTGVGCKEIVAGGNYKVHKSECDYR